MQERASEMKVKKTVTRKHMTGEERRKKEGERGESLRTNLEGEEER